MQYNIFVSSAVFTAKSILRPIRRTRYYNADGTRASTVPQRVKKAPFITAAVIALLAIPLIVMNAVRTDPELAEWWTIHIAQGYTRFAGAFTSWLAISVYELLIIILVSLCVFLFVRLVINLSKKRFKAILNGALAMGAAAMVVLNLYMASMGFGYYRADMPLPQAGANYKGGQAAIAARYFVDDFNKLCDKLERDENGCVICPYDFRELSKLMEKEYSRLDDEYFFSYTPLAKPVLNSKLLSWLSITGITFLPIGEASVNTDVPPTTVTYTMAHEIAHTKGVQREGDANLISYYVLLSSENDYLRYCGYYATIYGFIRSVSLAGESEQYSEIYDSVSKKPNAEYKYADAYWEAQPDIIGELGEFFNNIYLVFNGASNGTGSYNNGNQSGVIKPVDPETGDPIIDPDTQKPVIIPVYSQVQKLYFALYEQKFGVPPIEVNKAIEKRARLARFSID